MEANLAENSTLADARRSLLAILIDAPDGQLESAPPESSDNIRQTSRL
jgi:hypothetical protein